MTDKVAEISASFIDGEKLEAPGRVFIKEGLLAKVCRKTPKRRYFALFNDILVYGSIVAGTKKKYALQHIIRLDVLTVTSLNDSDLKNGFEIATPQKSFHVFASSLKDKEEWLLQFSNLGRLAVEKAAHLAEVGNAAAVWIPDHSVEICMVCNESKFTTFNRRHHCRRCGVVCCGGCSQNKMVLAHIGGKPLRVCNNCFHNTKPSTESPAVPVLSPGTVVVAARSPSDGSAQQLFKPSPPTKAPRPLPEIPPRKKDLTLEATSNTSLDNGPASPTSPTNPVPLPRVRKQPSSAEEAPTGPAPLIPPTPTKRPVINVQPTPPVRKKPAEQKPVEQKPVEQKPVEQKLPEKPATEGLGKANVIMDYIPSPYDEDALPLKAGEEVIILERNQSGVWRGKRAATGEIGMFPFRYIEEPDGNEEEEEDEDDDDEDSD